MRWFHNISFSSYSSCTAVWGKYFEDNNQNPHRSKGRQRYLGFRIAGARLRRKKEQEVPHDKKEAKVTSSSALAVPLPLPLPLPEGDGEKRLPSPKTLAAHYKGLEDKYAVESQTTPMVSREFASRDSRKTTKNVEQICSRMSQQEVNKGDKNVEHIGSRMSQQEVNMVHFPVSSAPTSQFGSPVGSPHKMSDADMFQHYMVPQGNQVWSAPEMNALDVTSPPSRACYDYNAFTADYTPLHSPPNRSPRRKNRSHSGPPSLIVHHMFSLESIEISSSRPESSSPISVHPLPLPPGAAMSSPSTSIPQLVNKPEACFMNSQWQKGKLIGRGTFGSVYVASNRETGALCAMKEVDIFPDDPKSAESIKQLEQEIKVLSNLKHPNIVQYYGSEIAEDKFYIFLEYVHPGSINKYVRDHCGAITESVVRNFTRHILCGLAYLHSTKTIHRDIKGANLLVDASGVVKLADFGMSKHLSGQRANLSLKGSPYWMAPELMQAVMQKDNSCELALAVDIWSLGCTIIEMFTGKAPWSEYEGAAAMFKVMRDTPSIPESLSLEGKDFLRCCFQRNPAKRPSASVLLEHRFVRSSLQSSAASSPSSFTGIKFTEVPIGRGERSEFKLAQLPVQQSLHSPKTVTPDYETAQRSAYKLLELTVAPRHSPRSHLEIPPGLSPNSNHPSPSGTTNKM